ncbi:hypothetical protein FHU36_004158 [Nonomuraea muscovyensis]|uniref:Uncharacterized protein n=1 Tax=Nonomuraea muscovyensis TaxID=1124761 RepID=A0A7X0EXH2_9ACTN|nr:hypothetical protein [Nonomuraea muscovyensis]
MTSHEHITMDVGPHGGVDLDAPSWPLVTAVIATDEPR